LIVLGSIILSGSIVAVSGSGLSFHLPLTLPVMEFMQAVKFSAHFLGLA
jgi:hypothetical protein